MTHFDDGLKWYQRFTWRHFSRLNTVVLAEALTERDSLAMIDAGGSVEMQNLSSPSSAENDQMTTPLTQRTDDEDNEDQERIVDYSVPETGPKELKRCLTAWELLGYGIASTAGSGIYVVTGTVVHSTGPAIVVSFLIAALAALLSALSYAEFAARVPLSGSAYTFAYVTLGELAAWFIGSNLTLEYSISGIALFFFFFFLRKISLIEIGYLSFSFSFFLITQLVLWPVAFQS